MNRPHQRLRRPVGLPPIQRRPIDAAAVTAAAPFAIEAPEEPAAGSQPLANGDLNRAVTVRGIKMSAGAREKIEAAGGRVEE